jgi:hypothetical protein
MVDVGEKSDLEKKNDFEEKKEVASNRARRSFCHPKMEDDLLFRVGLSLA